MQPQRTFQHIIANRDLRRRILISIGLLVIFRIISHIPLPSVDVSCLRAFFESNQVFGMLDLFSGGSVSRFSLSLLGVGPYITASIVFQLLTMVIPSLEALSKEGEYGRQKINQYTRYATPLFAIVETLGLLRLLQSQGVIGQLDAWQTTLTLVTATGASVLLMWIGEIISEKGIGNGISLIISLGIIAGLPPQITNLAQIVSGDTSAIIKAIIYLLIVLAMIVFIIWMNEAERRLPVTYARRLRSSQTATKIDSYLPIKVNSAGVIPIIFATSLLVFPGIVAQLFLNARSAWLRETAQFVQTVMNNNYYYAILFFVLVVAFTFFYTSVIVKPNQIAENLQKQGSFMPGIRPGQETSALIRTTVYRITSIGALFLGLVSVLPYIMQSTATEFRALALSGTGILIIVAVAIETMNQIKSHMATQSYEQYL